MNGTSWLLGANYPWFSGTAGAEDPGSNSAVVANAKIGLSLATLAPGPLGLESADDSLGRLTLPRGVAIDGNDLYLLSSDSARVFHYDAVQLRLVPLAHVGAEGLPADADDAAFREPRRFRGAGNIAIARGELYVADPAARRVQVFDLATLALLRIYAGLVEPVDVAADSDAVYVLDRGAGRVYRARPGSDCFDIAIEAADRCRGSRWDRIAVDSSGCVYLRMHRAEAVELDAFRWQDCRCGAGQERFYDADQVRDRFSVPRVVAGAGGAFDVAESLLDPCGLRRKFDDGTRAWLAGELLFVLDAKSRQLRAVLADGRTRHHFGPLDAAGRGVAGDADGAWLPSDVIELDGCVYVLDAVSQIVYRHRTGDSQLKRCFGAADADQSRWRRLASGGGCLLLWDGFSPTVERFDVRGASLGSVALRDVKARFERPTARGTASTLNGRVHITRNGTIPRPERELPAWPVPAYLRFGTWTSQWLDSDLYNCAWHVIELSVARMPAGSTLRVRARTSNEAQRPEEVFGSGGDLRAGSWRELPGLVAAAQPDPDSPEMFLHDVLVPNAPGQFLQLQITLEGNGATTPLVRHVRLRFPRESLLQYLPAIYSAPPEQRDFLDGFLSIAQTTWDRIENQVETFERFLDPDSVPDEQLPYLATWLDLRLERTWTPAQNRRLLKAMPTLRRRWGTVAGMRDWIRMHLAILGDLPEGDLRDVGVPGIVEKFVERRRLRLGDGGSMLCWADGLWSQSVERRLQVGVYDRRRTEAGARELRTGAGRTALSGRRSVHAGSRHGHRRADARAAAVPAGS